MEKELPNKVTGLDAIPSMRHPLRLPGLGHRRWKFYFPRGFLSLSRNTEAMENYHVLPGQTTGENKGETTAWGQQEEEMVIW